MYSITVMRKKMIRTGLDTLFIYFFCRIYLRVSSNITTLICLRPNYGQFWFFDFSKWTLWSFYFKVTIYKRYGHKNVSPQYRVPHLQWVTSIKLQSTYNNTTVLNVCVFKFTWCGERFTPVWYEINEWNIKVWPLLLCPVGHPDTHKVSRRAAGSCYYIRIRSS